MSLPAVEQLERLSTGSLASLRETLAAQGFTEDAIDRLDSIASAAPGVVRLGLVRGHLQDSTEPAQRLAFLLTFGGALARDEVDRLLGPALAGELIEHGLLEARGDRLRCPFRVVPYEGMWILADDVLDAPDSVMPPGPTTMLLAGLFPAAISGAVLDLGCGPGGLALVAAKRGARRSIGTDINPRAIAMARFNARWNALDTEFRVGSVFEPVARERFDLIVSQPPFISHPPETRHVTFLHGGARGDAIFLEIMRESAAHLTVKGETLVLCDIPLRRDEELGRYLRQELGAAGLHVLALSVAGPEPDMHALIYAGFGSTDLGAGYIAEVRRHRDHLQSLGVIGFRHGLFSARRPAPDARELHMVAVPVRDLAPATAEIRELLWAAVHGVSEPDPELLRRRVRVAPDATWISTRRAPEGEQSEHRVRFGPGWPAAEQIVTDEGLALASLLERTASVEEAVTGYAEMCDAAPAEVRAPLLEFIRHHLLTGMLVYSEPTRANG